MSTSRHHPGGVAPDEAVSYDEALSEIRKGADAETETGLQAINPLEHEAMLDLILELGARVTYLEKHAAKRLAEGETFSESKP